MSPWLPLSRFEKGDFVNPVALVLAFRFSHADLPDQTTKPRT